MSDSVHFSHETFAVRLNNYLKNINKYFHEKKYTRARTSITLFQTYFNDDRFTNEMLTVEKRRGFCVGEHKNEGSETRVSYATYTVRLKLQ